VKAYTGDSIILPAHKPNYVKPNGRFKMLLTVINSEYEDFFVVAVAAVHFIFMMMVCAIAVGGDANRG
jgi:hypothetical protein